MHVGIVKHVAVLVVIVVVQHCTATVDLYVGNRVGDHRQSYSAAHHIIIVIRRRILAESCAVRPIDRQVGHVDSTAVGGPTTQLVLIIAVSLIAEVRTRDDLLTAAAAAAATVPDSHDSRTQTVGDGS